MLMLLVRHLPLLRLSFQTIRKRRLEAFSDTCDSYGFATIGTIAKHEFDDCCISRRSPPRLRLLLRQQEDKREKEEEQLHHSDHATPLPVLVPAPPHQVMPWTS